MNELFEKCEDIVFGRTCEVKRLATSLPWGIAWAFVAAMENPDAWIVWI
jgi:hypothetical protein